MLRIMSWPVCFIHVGTHHINVQDQTAEITGSDYEAAGLSRKPAPTAATFRQKSRLKRRRDPNPRTHAHLSAVHTHQLSDSFSSEIRLRPPRPPDTFSRRRRLARRPGPASPPRGPRTANGLRGPRTRATIARGTLEDPGPGAEPGPGAGLGSGAQK